MSNAFINVHTFDGRLKGLFTPSRDYTIEEKREVLTHLLRDISNPFACKTVAMMISDLNNPKGQNYQAENNIDSSDVLMDILQWKDNPDVMKNLIEQLADTRSLGICPSGRVTRLLQLWFAFKEKVENKIMLLNNKI